MDSTLLFYAGIAVSLLFLTGVLFTAKELSEMKDQREELPHHDIQVKKDADPD